MSRSTPARDLELARVVASDPASPPCGRRSRVDLRAAEPRRARDDDAEHDAEVEEIARLVTYGTARHASAETRRACVEFVGTRWRRRGRRRRPRRRGGRRETTKEKDDRGDDGGGDGREGGGATKARERRNDDDGRENCF